MGYVSLTEDLVNKFNDMNSMIKKSSGLKINNLESRKPKMKRLSKDEFESFLEDYRFARRELKDSNLKLSETDKKLKLLTDKFGEMEDSIKSLQKRNENLLSVLEKKEKLLGYLKAEISIILEKNEEARKAAQNKSEEQLVNTINSLNSTNADVVLNIKAGIGQIAEIVNQPIFFKKTENLNNLKLIIKRLNEL